MRKYEGIVFYIFLFAFIYALSYAWPFVDYDFWARLLQGYSFLETGSIMFTDPFSYVPRHAWIDHEWGSGVVFAVIQNLFGYSGQILFKAILLFLIMFFIIKIIKLNGLKNTKPYNFLFFFFLIYFLELSVISGIRCHFFTFLFYTVFLYILEEVRINQKRKLLFILPVIMLFWANLHGGCVSGLGVILIYAAGEFLNKKPIKQYLLAFAGTSLMLFINPYGIEYIKFLIHATTMKRALIVEWENIFQKDFLNLLKTKIYAILAISTFLFTLNKKFKEKESINYTKIILITVTCIMSFSHVKHFPLFIITSAAFLYDDFYFFFNKFMQKVRSVLHINSETVTAKIVTVKEIIVYILILLEIQTLVAIHNRILYHNLFLDYPVKIVEFMKINNLRGTVLNHFGKGSYISYKLYPQNLIYVDGRYEEVYFDETSLYNWYFYNFESDDKVQWDTIFKVYGKPDYIFLDKSFLIFYNADKLTDYMEIYNDSYNYLYVRKDLLKNRYVVPNYTEKEYLDMYFDRMFKFSDFLKGRIASE